MIGTIGEVRKAMEEAEKQYNDRMEYLRGVEQNIYRKSLARWIEKGVPGMTTQQIAGAIAFASRKVEELAASVQAADSMSDRILASSEMEKYLAELDAAGEEILSVALEPAVVADGVQRKRRGRRSKAEIEAAKAAEEAARAEAAHVPAESAVREDDLHGQAGTTAEMADPFTTTA